MPQSKGLIADGPIPGENYTSDTRNYPWHRPPEITDIDEAIEVMIKRLTERETSYTVLSMLQAGVDVVTLTDIFVTSGIGKGKWTVDMALLLAGPTSHMIKLMAEGYGIKYRMGLDDDPMPTFAFLKAKSIDKDKAVEVADQAAMEEALMKQVTESMQPPRPATGFMGLLGTKQQEAPANNPMNAETPSEQDGSAPAPDEEGISV